ncbi:MAG TPA: SH3 domain-containing protein [Acidimicrobiia bacterium]|nr:SH3 domain-containing protein [Acidimicrobiia bacterium]
MTEDVLSRIASWCAADPRLTFVEEGPAVAVAGDPPLLLGLEVGEEEVLLSHRLELAGTGKESAAEALALVNKRGSLMRGTVQPEGDGLGVSVQYPIYLDGLTRQNFLLATQEMAGAVDAVGALGGTAAAEEVAVAPVMPEQPAMVEPEVIPEVTAATAAAAVAAAAPIVPAADTIEIAAPAQPATFSPTHEVPAGGMSAWARPDPSLQAAARLEARVQLRVDETRGAWARVTGSNGWTGWVDARRLAALGGAAAAVAAVPITATPVVATPAPAVTAQMPAIWQATCQAPAGGLPAWASPDPAQAPVAQLAERVQLRVEESLGAWARVSAENGWTGWVDGRRLAGLGAGTAVSGAGGLALGGLKIRPLPLIGGIALIVATFLNWLQLGSSNGFNIGLPFLWGGWEHGGDAPDLGIFTLIIGIGAVLLAVLPRTSVPAIRVLGVLAVVIAVVFAVQVMLWAGDIGGGAGDAFTDGMSYAPYVALAGGILMLLTRRD